MNKGVFFIRFAKPGRLKDTMSEWERQQNLKKTKKAKRWLHACGRKGFNRIEQVKKDAYICCLQFLDQKGPTEEDPNPMKAGDKGFFERRKRKPPKQRLPFHKKQKKDEFDIACYSGNVSSNNENTLLTTDTTDHDVTSNSIISNTETLFEKRTDTDSLKKKEIFDNNSMEKTLEKTTQTYHKYCLGLK